MCELCSACASLCGSDKLNAVTLAEKQNHKAQQIPCLSLCVFVRVCVCTRRQSHCHQYPPSNVLGQEGTCSPDPLGS